MLENLQLLRACAALAVVVYHVLYTGMEYGMPVRALAVFHGWGNVGVDLFFVLSGFVMVHAQRSRPKTASEFLRHRAARILPLYWLLTVLFIVLHLIAPGASRSPAPSWERAGASLLLVSTPVLRELPVIFVGWSLEYEMLFYLAFAAGIHLRRRIPPVWFVCGVLLVLASLSVYRWIVLEFLIGMATALVRNEAMVIRYRAAMLIAGTALLALVVKLFGAGHPSAGLPAGLIVLSAATLPPAGLPRLAFLGAASYSLYVVQVFTIPAFYKAAARVTPHLSGDILALIAVTLTTLAGCLLHIGLERPLAQALRPAAAAPRAASAAA